MVLSRLLASDPTYSGEILSIVGPLADRFSKAVSSSSDIDRLLAAVLFRVWAEAMLADAARQVNTTDAIEKLTRLLASSVRLPPTP
jgi:hypothetical protein